jgi:hypothetical protein
MEAAMPFSRLSLPFLLLLAACSGGPTVPSSAPAVSLPVKITLEGVPMILNPSRVPPDPGPAGDATIAGVDSNGNGIRDDVERWIAATYPASATMRAAMAQTALSLQIVMNGVSDTESAYRAGVITEAAISCLVDSEENPHNAGSTSKNMENLMLMQANNKNRINAYISFQNKLGSRAFRTTNNACNIPLDALHD